MPVPYKAAFPLQHSVNQQIHAIMRAFTRHTLELEAQIFVQLACRPVIRRNKAGHATEAELHKRIVERGCDKCPSGPAPPGHRSDVHIDAVGW